MIKRVELNKLNPAGGRLHRPECVLCTSDGSVFVSHWQGGVSRIHPDGCVEHFLPRDNPANVCTNGFAILPDGTFLLANLGESGGIWHLDRKGHLSSYLLEAEGESLPPCNFVMLDRQQRVWITVSTRRTPRSLGYRPDVSDGFIVCHANGTARIAADGLGYTNEAHFDPAGRMLYVNETFGRRLSRFAVTGDGQLHGKQTVCEFGPGVYPDGLCFDQSGGIWVTSIISNRLIYIGANADQHVIIDDSDAAHLAEVEEAFQSGKMSRQHLDMVRSRKLRQVSSMAFGGEDRDTGYLGCLLDEHIWAFDAGVTGAEPVHWHWSD